MIFILSFLFFYSSVIILVNIDNVSLSITMFEEHGLVNARINRFSDGFFPSTSHLWNSLPSSVFPASFNLPSFKRQVYHHLRGQMA